MTTLILTPLMVGMPQAADAHNFSGASGSVSNCMLNNAGSVNMADAQPHTYYYDASVVANDSVKIHQDWAWNSVYGPTSVNPLAQGSPTSSTDVVVYTQDYTTYCGRPWHPQLNGPVTIGLTVCISLNPGAQTCEKHEVRYDLSWWNQNMDNVYRRSATCHETGHTLGLTHSDETSPADTNDCMRANVSTVDYISEHDAMHINGGPPKLVSGSAVLPDHLNVNEQAISWDGRYHLIMQGDGNLVIYDRGTSGTGWTPIWASGTSSAYNTWTTLQGDGNLVVYTSDGFGTWALCSTRTNGHSGSVIVMQTDGNLVIYAPGGVPIWASRGGVCN